MNPHRPLAILVVLGLLPAQGVTTVSHPMLMRPHGATGTATDACVGDFWCSGYVDHAVVVDGAVWLHAMPRYGGAVEELPMPASQSLSGVTAVSARFRDHITFPSSQGVERRRDELLIADSNGLWRWFADANGTLNLILIDAGLAGAKAILPADLDSDSDGDLVVLAADGYTVKTLIFGNGSFGSPQSKTHGSSVFAIATLDNGTNRDVVFAAANGLWRLPWNLTGTAVGLDGSEAAHGFLATVRLEDESEVVAWVRRTENGNDILHVHGHSQADVDLGDLDVVGMAAGDVDGDGDDDLVLSQQANHCVTLMLNQDPGSTLFGATASLGRVQVRLQTNGENIAATGNQSRPLIADVNGDGDQDLIAINEYENSRWVCLLESTAADVGPLIVVPTDSPFYIYDSVVFHAYVSAGGAFSSGYTACEVLTWDLAYDSGAFSVVASTCEAQGLTSIEQSGLTLVQFNGDIDAYLSPGGQMVLWRPVEIQNGKVVRVGPAVCGFLLNALVDVMQSAEALQGSTAGAVFTPGGTDEEVEPDVGIRQIGWVTIEPPPAKGIRGPNG